MRLAALSLLLAASFGLGYLVKDEAVRVDHAKQAHVALKKSAQNVVVSVAESARIETEVAKVDTNVASIKAAIVKRGVTIHPKESHAAAAPDHDVRHDVQPDTAGAGTAAVVAHGPENACAGGTGFVLDHGTVSLLNAARQGRGVDAAGGSDEEKSAPSSVEVRDLIANDLDIVQMYLDLAKRHDELIDSVEKHLKEQAR